MKKILLLGLLLIIPTIMCIAEQKRNYTKDQIFKELNIYEKNGEYNIDVKMLDIKVMNPSLKNTCSYSYIKEDLLNQNPEYFGKLTEEELDAEVKVYVDYCYGEEYQRLIDLYFSRYMKLNIKYEEDYIFSYVDSNHFKLNVTPEIQNDLDPDQETYMIKVNFIEKYNKEEYNKLIKMVNELKDEYVTYGLQSLNNIMHYGGIWENSLNNDLILYRYPDFKEFLESNDVTYTFHLGGSGGDPIDRGNTARVALIHNGVLYAYKFLNFSFKNYIFVDESESGTTYEKAKKKVMEYFDNSEYVKFSEYDSENKQEELLWYNNIVNNFLNTKNVNYKMDMATLELGKEKHIANILIIEVPKSKIKEENVKAKDRKSGINIDTNSWDVPVDVQVIADDVKNEKYVTNAFNNYEISKAYDIKIKGRTNNNLISKVNDYVNVYIPIEDKKVGEKVNVYYITDDSKINQTITGTVMKKDNKKYVYFKTNHFSTYVIANKLNKEQPSIVEKSNNTNLKSLSINGNLINFSNDNLIYNLEFENDIDKIKIEAISEDEKTIIEGIGEYTLNVGSNKYDIVVKAEDRTQKTIILNIVRKSKEDEINKEDETIKENIKEDVNEKKSNNIIIYIISFSIIVIVIVSIILFKKRI